MSVSDLAAAYERQAKIRDGIRWLQCCAAGRVQSVDPVMIFQQRYPNSRNLDLIRRAAIPAGATDNWGEPLVASHKLLADYGLVIRARDLLGQLAALGANRLDFETRVPVGGPETTRAAWIGEGGATPFGRLNVSDGPTLWRAKLGLAAALTQELAVATGDVATSFCEAWISDIVTRFTAEQLLDPTITRTSRRAARPR